MEEVFASFMYLVKDFHKTLKSRKSKTVSDSESKLSAKEIFKVWQAQIKPNLLSVPSLSQQIYVYDSLFDRLVNYTTKTSSKTDYLNDLGILIRGFERDIAIPHLKHSFLHKDGQRNDMVVPENFANLRKYLKDTMFQINTTYAADCYDACALMLRKLVELMLYDYYEMKKRDAEITDENLEYKKLATIINLFVNQSGEKPSRPLKDFLEDARFFGNVAAHNRRVTVEKTDIDRIGARLDALLRELYQIVYTTTFRL